MVMLRRLLLALAVVCAACGSSVACDDARGCVAEARQADDEGRYEDAYASYTTAMSFVTLTVVLWLVLGDPVASSAG